MKKKMGIIVLALLLVVLSVEGYFCYKSYKNTQKNTTYESPNVETKEEVQEEENIPEALEKEENTEVVNEKEEPVTDGVTLVSTTETNKGITQVYEIVLNGNKTSLNVEFTFETYENNTAGYIVGKLKENDIYKNYFDTNVLRFNVNYINTVFSENNFKIIKGVDNKNYLVVLANYPVEISVYSAYIQIYNDKFERLDEDYQFIYINSGRGIYFNENFEKDDVWYDDEFKVGGEEDFDIWSKVDTDKFYYLYYDCKTVDWKTEDLGYVEERVYTINNNKLEYKVINKIKVLNSAGGDFCE